MTSSIQKTINKRASQMKGKGKTKKVLHLIGSEMKNNPPTILSKTMAKFGKARAEAQRKAILLSKARKAGANIPKA